MNPNPLPIAFSASCLVHRFLAVGLLLCLPLWVRSEIVTDGSTGAQVRLSGAEMPITADLGQERGANLFHSFQTFQVSPGESAVFSGAANIENVIARVTGGELSVINGAIKNTIPGAHTYLFNPAGWLFGEGARLEVSGGFHAATAQALDFADQSRFSADKTQGSAFTSAPPAAFGLLGQGGLQVNGGALLQAPTLDLQGGTLDIGAAKLEVKNGTLLNLQGDNINLRSEARLSSLTDTAERGADIRLSATQKLSIQGHNEQKGDSDSLTSLTTGSGDAGNIYLSGAQVQIQNATLTGNTEAQGRGADIRISAREQVVLDSSFVFVNSQSFDADAGLSGNLSIQAHSIELRNNSILNAGVMGYSNGGNVSLQASEDILLGEYSHIYADTYLGSGNGGLVSIQGRNISLLDGAFIDTTTKNVGNAGNIAIHAQGTFKLAGDNTGSDTDATGRSSMVASGTFPLVGNVAEYLGGLGRGGTIDIQAQDLVLEEGGLIYNDSLALPGSGSGAAGNINLIVAGTTRLSGVNPRGETVFGFGSGIYLRSQGQNAGAGGNLSLQTGTLQIEKGAVIISSTTSANPGGSLDIQVADQLLMSGDASQIALYPPEQEQLSYLQNYSPPSYNQSVSGIYSRAEVQYFSTDAAGNKLAGAGGELHIQAKTLELREGAMISSSSTGVGLAGNLDIDVGELRMEKGTSISSDSTLPNSFSFANSAERDARLSLTDDLLEVANVGNGRADYYVQTAQTLQRVHYRNVVSTYAALNTLNDSVALTDGDVVQVLETGQSYMYASWRSGTLDNSGISFKWIPFNAQKIDVVLPDLSALEHTSGWLNLAAGETPPYAEGAVIQALDASNGKSVYFVYTYTPDVRNAGYIFNTPFRIQSFSVTTPSELAQLGSQISLATGNTASITAADGNISHFVYQNQQWSELPPPRNIADIASLNALVLARPGYVSELPSGRMVSSGSQWLSSQNTYRVATLAERDALPAQNGDLVTVTNIGNGQYENYFYDAGQWIVRTHGGNAGQIEVQAEQGIRLSDNSRITTEVVSAGGGGIQLQNNGVLNMHDSQITASVREGAGNGGNVQIQSEFIVQNQSPIVARAIEGNGGNIQISSKGIFQFAPASKSPIDASSQFGLAGTVELSTPEEQLSGSESIVSGNFLQAQGLAANQCAVRDIAELNFFKAHMEYSGTGKNPENFQE